MTDLVWTNEIRKIKALKDFEKNPRQITEEQFERLKQSLQNFGYVEPIVIDTDCTIIAGHMRVRALRKLNGNKGDIEVRVPNRPLTERERDEYTIISNKVRGDWDYDIMSDNWDMDMLLDLGFIPGDFGIDMIMTEEKEEKPKKVKECPHCGEKI